MPSNILNKISDKLTGHEESHEEQQSSSTRSQQQSKPGRASGYGNEDTEFDNNQTSSSGGRGSRTKSTSKNETNYGDHKRGAFADELAMRGEDRSYNANEPSETYRKEESFNSSRYEQKQPQQTTMRGSNSYNDDYGNDFNQQYSKNSSSQYGSSAPANSEDMGDTNPMTDKFRNAAEDHYNTKGTNKDSDFMSNNF